jgi:hypothetical protein
VAAPERLYAPSDSTPRATLRPERLYAPSDSTPPAAQSEAAMRPRPRGRGRCGAVPTGAVPARNIAASTAIARSRRAVCAYGVAEYDE